MKHNLLSLMLATTIISVGTLSSQWALAQEATLPEAQKFEHKFDRAEMRQKMAEKIAKDLELSAEQQAQAKEIRERGKKDIEPLMKEMKDLREKMDSKRRTNMEEFESILTSQQKAKFQELKKQAQHRENMEHFDALRHHPKFPPMRKDGENFRAPMRPEAPEIPSEN